jgi:hypothetical protein
MSIIGVSASPGARQADFGMPPTRPVDRHSDFVFGIVQIDDHFLYQNPGQPLLGSALSTPSKTRCAASPPI